MGCDLSPELTNLVSKLVGPLVEVALWVMESVFFHVTESPTLISKANGEYGGTVRPLMSTVRSAAEDGPAKPKAMHTSRPIRNTLFKTNLQARISVLLLLLGPLGGPGLSHDHRL